MKGKKENWNLMGGKSPPPHLQPFILPLVPKLRRVQFRALLTNRKGEKKKCAYKYLAKIREVNRTPIHTD
jgi:hypothetical protein